MSRVRVNIGGRWYNVEVGDVQRNPVEVVVEGQRYLVEMESALSDGAIMPGPQVGKQDTTPKQEITGLRGIIQGDDRVIRCPMPGRIVAVELNPGDTIKPGDEICVLETMKMEQSVRSSHEGTVRNVHIKRGQNIHTGAPLVDLE